MEARVGGLRCIVYAPTALAAATERPPLLIYLHGRPESGSMQEIRSAGLPALLEANSVSLPFFVVAPRCGAWSSWKRKSSRVPMLIEEMATRGADPERVFLAGIGMGAFGAFQIAHKHPERFAAIVGVGGGPSFGALLRDVLRMPRSFLPAHAGIRVPPHGRKARARSGAAAEAAPAARRGSADAEGASLDEGLETASASASEGGRAPHGGRLKFRRGTVTGPVPRSIRKVAADIFHIPVWLWHADRDPVMPLRHSAAFARTLIELGARDVRFTSVPSRAHDVSAAVFGDAALVEWLLSMRRAAPVRHF